MLKGIGRMAVRPSDEIDTVAVEVVLLVSEIRRPVTVVCGGVNLFTACPETNPLQIIEAHEKECSEYPGLDPEKICERRTYVSQRRRSESPQQELLCVA